MIDERFVILGAVISSIGQISYIADTVRGKIKPNRVTWFLWAVIPLIAFAAEIQQGVGIHSLMTFMVGFGPLCIFIASFVNKKSYWKISRLDIFCAAVSVLGVFLWLVTRNANLAILLSIFADGSAGFPTLIKAFGYPESESSSIYTLTAINSALTLLAVKVWDFAHFAFPLYILVLCLIMVGLVRFRLGKQLIKQYSAIFGSIR